MRIQYPKPPKGGLNQNKRIMNNSKKVNKVNEVEQKLNDLCKAYKNNDLTVNEYQSMYYATAQQLKKLKNF